MSGTEPPSTQADRPELTLADWADTCATLHLWTQVVRKIRLAHAPMVNHWWQSALYVVPSAFAPRSLFDGAWCGYRAAARETR
jgi:Family of unknown function (DUF5996)